MSDINTQLYFSYDFVTGETITRELTADEIAALPEPSNEVPPTGV